MQLTKPSSSSSTVSTLIALDGLCALSIRDSVFTNNAAQSMIFIGIVPNPLKRSFLSLQNVTFQHNDGTYIFNGNSADGIISHCSFSYNSLTPVYIINSNLTITDCEFLSNLSNYSQIISYVDNDGITTLDNFTIIIRDCFFKKYFSLLLYPLPPSFILYPLSSYFLPPSFILYPPTSFSLYPPLSLLYPLSSYFLLLLSSSPPPPPFFFFFSFPFLFLIL